VENIRATTKSRQTASLFSAAKQRNRRPRPADFFRLIEDGGAGKGTGRFFREVAPEEKQKLEIKRERRRNRTERTVKARRFISRNRIAFGVGFSAAVIAAAIVISIVQGLASRPSTRGLEPEEVAQIYYNSFNTLDHMRMETCVVGKAGKSDVTTVTNLFVLGRVRQAYEAETPIINPEAWMKTGGGPTTQTVFGISDFTLFPEELDDSDGEVSFRSEYLLWSPFANEDDPEAAFSSDTAEDINAPKLPAAVSLRDTLTLARDRKGLWHIAELVREKR
jgi:hypothetical protein